MTKKGLAAKKEADYDLRLAQQTGLGEKTLRRILNRSGNPTARNLGVIMRSVAEDLGVKPRVEVALCR